MNRAIIANLAVEIVSMVLIILVTIPIWNGFQINEMRELAEFYDDLYYISYKVVDNENGKTIMLDNATYTSESYNLVMIIDSKEEVDDLTIEVNDVNKKISEYKIINKDDKKYIILDNSSLKAESKSYNIANSKQFVYELDVVENI